MGQQAGVSTRLKKFAPYLTVTHCYTHRVNWVAQALKTCELMQTIEKVLRDIAACFSQSAKRVAELAAVQELVGTPSLRMLRPSDTRWMSVAGCYRTVGRSYLALLAYMKRAGADHQELFAQLCDTHVVLSMRIPPPTIQLHHHRRQTSDKR